MCVRACAYTFIYITSLTQGQGAKSSRRSVRHGPSPAFWPSVAEDMPEKCYRGARHVASLVLEAQT